MEVAASADFEKKGLNSGRLGMCGEGGPVIKLVRNVDVRASFNIGESGPRRGLVSTEQQRKKVFPLAMTDGNGNPWKLPDFLARSLDDPPTLCNVRSTYYGTL